jgi:enolase-phosphatase E1
VLRAVLLDVEGTTTPAEFVNDILFPFARAHLDEFLANHLEDPETIACLDRLRTEHGAEPGDPPPWSPDDSPASAAAYLRWQMDQDRKSTPLKSLQGRIWEAGYRDGSLRAPVYDDVPRALRRWRDAGRRIAIFSSGSAQAQHLLFAHTTQGDLTGWLSAYFDTATGSKREASSYRAIAEHLGLPTKEVLFVSDVSAELDAATVAAMDTALCVRSDRPNAANGLHPAIASFDEIP